MKLDPILSQLFRHKWAIDLNYAIQQGPVIDGLMKGNMIDRESLQNNIPSSISASSGQVVQYWSWDEAPKESIALINIKGEIMKSNQSCGPVGTAELGRRVKEADEDPRFVGIMLVIDSPGGTVDGTEVFANIIKNTKKPVLAYVDGLMASAAAWIGTGANEIWASTDTDEIGSIGVLMNFWDIIPAYERLGYKFHMITASTSDEKMKLFEDLRAGKYKEYQETVLDVLDEKFMNTVKENRPNVKDEHLRGKVFFAKDLLGVLVDQIGTFEEAVDRLYEMSKITSTQSVAEEEEEEESTEITINASNKMEKLTLLMAAMGVTSLESADGSVSLNEEQLTAIEAALQTAADAKTNIEAQVAKLTTDLKAEQDARATDATTIQDKEDANKALRSENDSLKKAAAGGNGAIAKDDKTGEDKKEAVEGLVTSEDKGFVENLEALSEELGTIS